MNPKTRSHRSSASHDYLVELYDKLNDSQMQQKFRRLAPMPVGVVFLPWPGMTEDDARRHFRLMKQLGFNCLKQTMPTVEWPRQRTVMGPSIAPAPAPAYDYAGGVTMRMRLAAVAAAVLDLAVLPAARVPVTASGGQKVLPNNHEVKHVIIMVADGMGLADVTAARIRENGIAGPPLRFETLDEIGYQRTFSELNTVTDSAAAASACACGEKFVNDEICMHTEGFCHCIGVG